MDIFSDMRMVAEATRICLEAIEKLGEGIVFVRLKAHGQLLAGSILPEALGYEVPFVNGDMLEKERESAAARLRSGECKVVVATACWSAGIDIPNLRWVMKLDMGKAPIRFLQDIGRGLRKHDDKEELVVFVPRVSGREDINDEQQQILNQQGVSLDKEGTVSNSCKTAFSVEAFIGIAIMVALLLISKCT